MKKRQADKDNVIATYADFFIVATLQMINRIDAKIFARLVEMEDSLEKVHTACKPWLERDDH